MDKDSDEDLFVTSGSGGDSDSSSSSGDFAESDSDGSAGGKGAAAAASRRAGSKSAKAPAKRGTKRGGAAAARGKSALPSMQSTSVAAILRKVEALAKRTETVVPESDALQTLAKLGHTEVTSVAERDVHEVQASIENELIRIACSILDGAGFSYSVPNRGSTNQLYIPELDRIVLRAKSSDRPFANASSVRKATIMTRVLELIHEILRKDIHTTKRDLFYTDVKLFKTQDESNAVLDDVATMLGCTRTSLHVVASEKGVVVGALKFRENGDDIDCSRMGVGGKAIPPHVDLIDNIQSDAKFILVVEKDAAFMRLAEDRFYNKYPCVIITAKGQPDVATRLFLRKIRTALAIPVLGLVDSDPYGLKIISVYMNGSKNMSYDSSNLTTPDIKWLGVRPSDLDKYDIPDACRLPMTDRDIKAGQDMLKEDFIKNNPAWMAELELMLKRKEKAEIQALSAYGFQYLTEEYLPRKLKEGDWI